MLSRLNKGEQFIVVAGGLLLLSLLSFPWHRVEVPFVGSVRRTGLQSPNSLQGTLAFLVTIAMVAQVVLSRFTNQKVNPALARLQPAAGLAVVGLLAWKLAAETSYLSVGAYLGILLAGALAYGAFLITKESSSGGPTAPKQRRVAVPKLGRKKDRPPEQPVIVLRPGEDGSPYAYIVDLNDHVARLDGSFSAGRARTVDSLAEGIGFDTSEEAVRWAEQHGWTVLNKKQL